MYLDEAEEDIGVEGALVGPVDHDDGVCGEVGARGEDERKRRCASTSCGAMPSVRMKARSTPTFDAGVCDPELEAILRNLRKLMIGNAQHLVAKARASRRPWCIRLPVVKVALDLMKSLDMPVLLTVPVWPGLLTDPLFSLDTLTRSSAFTLSLLSKLLMIM